MRPDTNSGQALSDPCDSFVNFSVHVPIVTYCFYNLILKKSKLKKK